MEKFYDLVQKKKKIFWLITLIYIIFNGCCMFPLIKTITKTETKTIDYSFLFSIAVGYIMIALFLFGLLRAKPLKVFLLTLLFTAIGMGCRYILEFGEVSNTVNFTGINILVFLTVIPLFVMLAYLVIPILKFD